MAQVLRRHLERVAQSRRGERSTPWNAKEKTKAKRKVKRLTSVH